MNTRGDNAPQPTLTQKTNLSLNPGGAWASKEGKPNPMKRILLLGALALTWGCSSLSTITSLNYQEVVPGVFSHYDSESKLQYLVANDQDNLTLGLRTTDRFTIMKMIRGGMKVYLDTTGEKSEHYALEFPLPTKLGDARPRRGSGEAPNLSKMLAQVAPQAILRINGVETVLDLSRDDNPVAVGIFAPGDMELVYELTIPLSELSTSGPAGLKNLAIGIETGAIEMPNRGQRPGSEGMGPGGGMRGSGQRPSGGMGGPGGGPGAGQNMANITTPIKLWFGVELAK